MQDAAQSIRLITIFAFESNAAFVVVLCFCFLFVACSFAWFVCFCLFLFVLFSKQFSVQNSSP